MFHTVVVVKVLIGLAVVLLVGLASFLGWRWGSEQTSIALSNPLESTEEVTSIPSGESPALKPTRDPAIPLSIKVVSDKVVEAFVANVAAPTKPTQVMVRIMHSMPPTFENLLSVSRDTVEGVKGVGVGCGLPTYTDAGTKVEVPLYIATEALIARDGEAEALNKANSILRECLTWSAWGYTTDRSRYNELAALPNTGDNQPVLLRITP